MVELMAERGIGADALTAGTGLQPAHLRKADSRMSAAQWGQVILNAMNASGCAALGYEYGLRMPVSVHGFLGFAAITSLTGTDALAVLERYFQTRQRNLSVSWRVEGDSCVIGMRELHPLGPVRAFVFEALLLSCMRALAQHIGVDEFAGMELNFDWEEPAYHASYRDRLPPTRFGQPGNFLRFPSRLLSARPALADASASQQAIERCEQELVLTGGFRGSLTSSVCAAMVVANGGYLSQQQMADRLHLSSRSLTRKLHAEGTSFTQLLEVARRRDALQLVEHSDLKLEVIAAQLGYLNPASFTRAFRGWTGVTPSQRRKQVGRDRR